MTERQEFIDWRNDLYAAESYLATQHVTPEEPDRTRADFEVEPTVEIEREQL